MASTRKVVIVTASTIAGQCLLAGIAVAAGFSKLDGGESVSIEAILAGVSALCVGILGTALFGVRQIIKAVKHESENPFWQLFANQINRDTDVREMLKQIVTKIEHHDDMLKPIVEDYMMRKASKETGRPWDTSD